MILIFDEIEMCGDPLSGLTYGLMEEINGIEHPITRSWRIREQDSKREVCDVCEGTYVPNRKTAVNNICPACKLLKEKHNTWFSCDFDTSLYYIEYDILEQEARDILYEEEVRKAIYLILDEAIPVRENAIIRMRLGLLDDESERSLEEIADALNITQGRVRQLESNGLKRLGHTRGFKHRVNISSNDNKRYVTLLELAIDRYN